MNSHLFTHKIVVHPGRFLPKALYVNNDGGYRVSSNVSELH